MSNNANGFGIGLLVGVVLGLLFAPRPGKETRAILKKGYEGVKERVVEVIEEMGEKSTQVMEKAADAGHRAKKHVGA